MRVPAECAAKSMSGDGPCTRSAREKPDQDLHTVYLKEMPAADVHSGKLTLRCEQGDTTVATLPMPDFELLFDVGCSALLDDYPREAITTFASSFERFVEFSCRLLLARGNVSFEGVDCWWKDVAKHSERQRGSFVALWIAHFRSPPPLLHNELVELRNTAFTRAYSAESAAREYGEGVLRSVVGGIVTLRNCFDSELEYDDFVEHHILRLGAGESHFSFIANTVLSGMWRPNENRPDEDEPESGDGPEKRTKNPTDPTRLTMDRALRTFAALRSLGMRRK
jgi:hypothetical protein